MIGLNKQKREIETIKGRSLTLQLSDADVRRIWEKAGSAGLTVEQLLTSFIGDLVDGTYSNGSDERMYADDWFNRCGFEIEAEPTFLKYAINNWVLNEILELHSDLQSAKEDVEGCPELFSPEELQEMQQDVAEWQKELDEHFRLYKDANKGRRNGTFEDEMGKILKWEQGYRAMRKATEERNRPKRNDPCR